MLTPAKRLILMGRRYKNFVVNGSFESASGGWDSGTLSLRSTKMAYLGSYSVKNPIYKIQEVIIPNGHVVYLSEMHYLDGHTSGDFRFGTYNMGTYKKPDSVLWSNTDLKKWIKSSVRRVVENGGIRVVLQADGTEIIATTYRDCITAIDLTAEFGAGNEPNKAWCDANITPQSIIW